MIASNTPNTKPRINGSDDISPLVAGSLSFTTAAPLVAVAVVVAIVAAAVVVIASVVDGTTVVDVVELDHVDVGSPFVTVWNSTGGCVELEVTTGDFVVAVVVVVLVVVAFVAGCTTAP